MQIPAAWHPDPLGRYEYRYWDGQAWTQHVASQGIAGVDPQPIATGSPQDATGSPQEATPTDDATNDDRDHWQRPWTLDADEPPRTDQPVANPSGLPTEQPAAAHVDGDHVDGDHWQQPWTVEDRQGSAEVPHWQRPWRAERT